MPSSATTDINTSVRLMFDSVSSRYDLLNRLLSASLDRSWRRRAVALLPPARLVLDLCTGTGDITREIHTQQQGATIVSADFSLNMLRLAAAKISLGTRLVQADARSLAWRSAVFDAVTIAFGIRNVYPPEAALGEIARVLRPGGDLLVLEFFGPQGPGGQRLFGLYFRHILPRLGGWISGDPGAYSYLPESVGRFADRERFGQLLRESGLAPLHKLEMSGGIATAILARKEAE